MNTPAPGAASLCRVLEVLSPYRGDLVLIGGWAHRLYPQHEWATPGEAPPLMTHDIDLAVSEPLPVKGRSMDALLREAAFRCELSGTEDSPASRYVIDGLGGASSVEFVTCTSGDGLRRGGGRDATVELSGVTAARLRFVDVLLARPWELLLTRHLGFPVAPAGLRVRVANPASFMAQKLLALPKRAPEKQGKDVLYIHDTLSLFVSSLPGIAGAWRETVPQLHPKRARDVVLEARKQFITVTDSVRRAGVIAVQSGRPEPPPPERIASACRLGLEAVFGA